MNLNNVELETKTRAKVASDKKRKAAMKLEIRSLRYTIDHLNKACSNLKQSLDASEKKLLRLSFYDSRSWNALKWKTLRNYISLHGRTCQQCDNESAVLFVQHDKPRETHPELQLEESNLVVVCILCTRVKEFKRDLIK